MYDENTVEQRKIAHAPRIIIGLRQKCRSAEVPKWHGKICKCEQKWAIKLRTSSGNFCKSLQMSDKPNN